ncbi:Scr1 family TA system antitoxin-like transcriptional regulator [Nocardia otitidiscaviarum]|nr:Scr1 family TA system antitoxin-like transcriptional regulator [Nocardia otitidiscaviarum]
MADQLLHLVDMAQRPNVSIRVIPFDAQGHSGSLVCSFVFAVAGLVLPN